MVVDSSALVAVFRREPEARSIIATVRTAHRPVMSAANVFETLMVLAGRTGGSAWPQVERFLRRLSLEVIPLSLEHTLLANDAFLRFGKGRHRAALNYGDCFAYALARHLDLPLLFKGDDFGHTDIRSAR